MNRAVCLCCVLWLGFAACNYPGFEPTSTPTPTDTPVAEPTATASPQARPPRTKIDVDTISALALAGEERLGEMISLSWDSSEDRAAVATLQGLFLLQFSPELERFDIGLSSASEVSLVELGGSYLAVGHVDGNISIWDLETDQQLYVRGAGVDTVTALAFSPGGGILATATLDGMAGLWSVKAGQPFIEYQFDSWAESIAFSPVGDLVALDIVEQSVQIYSSRSGALEHELRWVDRAGPIYYVQFAPDWDHLVWVSRASALMMDVESGEPQALLGHEDFIGTSSFSPRGEIFASTTAQIVEGELQGVVKLWSVPGGELLEELIVGEGAVSLAFSPDGRLLALGMPDGSVQFWEVETGMLAGEFEAHTDLIFDLHFLRQGKLLVTASTDGLIRAWSPSE